MNRSLKIAFIILMTMFLYQKLGAQYIFKTTSYSILTYDIDIWGDVVLYEEPITFSHVGRFNDIIIVSQIPYYSYRMYYRPYYYHNYYFYNPYIYHYNYYYNPYVYRERFLYSHHGHNTHNSIHQTNTNYGHTKTEKNVSYVNNKNTGRSQYTGTYSKPVSSSNNRTNYNSAGVRTVSPTKTYNSTQRTGTSYSRPQNNQTRTYQNTTYSRPQNTQSRTVQTNQGQTRTYQSTTYSRPQNTQSRTVQTNQGQTRTYQSTTYSRPQNTQSRTVQTKTYTRPQNNQTRTR
jgi:hypothetical protein